MSTIRHLAINWYTSIKSGDKCPLKSHFPISWFSFIETLHKEIQIRWNLVNFESLNRIKLLVQFYKLSVAEKPFLLLTKFLWYHKEVAQ